jgi:integrase
VAYVSHESRLCPHSEAEARDRVLSAAELAEFWNALTDDDYGAIVKLLMLTGQRREEIGGLCWSEVDLDRHKPFVRVDRLGLLWLLNGRHIVALTADSATIAASSGGRLTYHRVPTDPGRVLAWSLYEAAP